MIQQYLSVMRYYQAITREFLLKLHTDPTTALNTVTAYGNGYIEVCHVRFPHAVTFGPQGQVAAWPVQVITDISLALLCQAAHLNETEKNPMSFLDEGEYAPLSRCSHTPEILLLGTGNRQHFLPAALLQPLMAAGVGVEMMDTRAAARTYNILMNEGRRVVAALMIPTGES